jgi:ribosomal protein S13
MSTASAHPANFLPRVLVIACLLLLIAVGTLLAQVLAQRAALAAQATQAALSDQEIRALRQQLEAERLIAAAQSRLLRDALGRGTANPPSSAP